MQRSGREEGRKMFFFFFFFFFRGFFWWFRVIDVGFIVVLRWFYGVLECFPREKRRMKKKQEFQERGAEAGSNRST